MSHHLKSERDQLGGKSRFNPFAEKIRSKNKTKALDSMKVGHGKSRFSGKTYKH